MINGKKIEDIAGYNGSNQMIDLPFIIDDLKVNNYLEVDCVNTTPQNIWRILQSLKEHGEIASSDPESGIDFEKGISVVIPDLLSDNEQNKDLALLHEVKNPFILKKIKHYIFEHNEKYYFVNYGKDEAPVLLKLGFDVDEGFYATDVNHFEQLNMLETLQKLYLCFQLNGGMSIFDERGYELVSEAKISEYCGKMFDTLPDSANKMQQDNNTVAQNRKPGMYV